MKSKTFDLARARGALGSAGRRDQVVLPGVGRHIGQDGHLVDVGIVFRVYVFQFRMEGFIAGAGEAGIAFGDLDEGISCMEVGVVVISW